MSKSIGMCAGLALAGALASGGAAFGGETREVARKLLDQYKDAVVLVEAVAKVKFAGQGGQTQEREHRMETNGTVISADGLTVLSHSGVDPSRAYGRYGLKIDVATSDVKIVLADGTEHEADLVLTDKDLDLAFVRPKGEVKLPCVEMKKGADPELLDQLVSITRMGRKANREPGVAVSEVLSILRKPRVRYMVSGQIFQGCPVFKAGGEVLGLALVQADTGLSVLPCDDVLEAAKQAAAKKPGETAPPPKADPADEGGGKGQAPEKAPEKPAEEPAEG